jgi:hypothetical protein
LPEVVYAVPAQPSPVEVPIATEVEYRWSDQFEHEQLDGWEKWHVGGHPLPDPIVSPLLEVARVR